MGRAGGIHVAHEKCMLSVGGESCRKEADLGGVGGKQ